MDNVSIDNVLTIISNDVTILTHDFLQQFGATKIEWLKNNVAVDLFNVQNIEAIPALIAQLPLDYCLQHLIGQNVEEQNVKERRKKLLVSDMDSTIIAQECIDEIADIAGVGEQVANITKRAMAGEIDFSQSLIARVALLKGVKISVLEQVWQERITMQSGAAELVHHMNEAGAFTMLVSGGFTYFTEKVATKLGFQAHFANELLIENDCLTGEVRLPILHQGSKKEILLQYVAQLRLDISQIIAVGDGANDADMIMAAGLGVAYHAKPYLQGLANCSINHTDLRSLLYFQGMKL